MSTLQEILKKAFDHPTDQGSDHGFQWDSTSKGWAEMCSVLPCFQALAWPDYDTKTIDHTLFGEPVVVQLWKGRCPQFMGRTNFPGGIGGEVGIYQRVAGKKMPDISWLPLPLQLAYQGALKLSGTDLWWPVPLKLQPKISWTLINPETKTALFDHAKSDQTYWLTKWMEFDSFKQYQQANKTPFWSTDFHMVATIDDGTNARVFEW